MQLLQLDLFGAPQDRATLATKCYSCDKDLTTQEKQTSEKITDKGEYLRVMCEACELEEHEHNEHLDAYYKWEAGDLQGGNTGYRFRMEAPPGIHWDQTARA